MILVHSSQIDFVNEPEENIIVKIFVDYVKSWGVTK